MAARSRPVAPAGAGLADLARSFAPLARPDARVLILGSMPGRASLQAGQYYAHPRNAFWRIMAALLGLDAEAGYAARTEALTSSGVALWDVLKSCERPGSLDARIEPGSVVVNDFAGFLRRHRGIGAVFFNGSTAELLYRRHVLPGAGLGPLHYTGLPSTSPAHAGMPFGQKLQAWRAVRSCLYSTAPARDERRPA